jgi:hypothetical protein
VIDSNPASPTYNTVIESVQELDANRASLRRAGRHAFASNIRRALRNDIAIVDG